MLDTKFGNRASEAISQSDIASPIEMRETNTLPTKMRTIQVRTYYEKRSLINKKKSKEIRRADRESIRSGSIFSIRDNQFGIREFSGKRSGARDRKQSGVSKGVGSKEKIDGEVERIEGERGGKRGRAVEGKSVTEFSTDSGRVRRT